MPSLTHRTEAAALEQLGAPRSSGGRGGQQAGGREEACLRGSFTSRTLLRAWAQRELSTWR